MPVQVKAESAKVWKFIIHREIEAPARFQAIQTHRATMAIIRQQACRRLPPALIGSCVAGAPHSAQGVWQGTKPWPPLDRYIPIHLHTRQHEFLLGDTFAYDLLF